MDPRMKDFPFMSDGFPWRIFGICVAYVLIAKLWKPDMKGTDVRPLILIFNGLAFGIHGMGVIFALVLDFGGAGVDCSPLNKNPLMLEPTIECVKTASIVYITVIFVLLRIYLLSEAILLMMATGRSPSNWRLANDIALLLTVYFGVKYLPGGPSLFFGFTYLGFYTCVYGYYALKMGYSQAEDVILQSRKYFIYLKFVWAALTFGHHLYLAYYIPCTRQNIVLFPLSFTEFFYGIGLFCNAVYEYRKLLSDQRAKMLKSE